MNMTMTSQRGYQSALSACPAPAAAFAATEPAKSRLRAITGAVATLQGTGLSFDGGLMANLRTIAFVQPHPGDTALRPPG